MSLRRRLSVAVALTVTAAGVAIAAEASAATRYEAESAPATCDGVIESNHAGFSGSGFCNAGNAAGAAAQFTVTAPAAGTATINIRYANGGTSNRPADVLVNGTVAHTGSAFDPTRGFLTETFDVGRATGAPVIDLHKLSYTLYNSLRFCPFNGDYSSGPVGAFFADDHTHFEAAGARQIAGLVTTAVRDQQLALSAYLR
ncbi:CBM35 domain-containing protein [Streptosporangium sp. LJ11]|uniref:CBM35 domain-containing protein n=1 Tax=Streptosporangium sp. LJ11 TaxID=3436927 RepID=UPI003F79FDEA